MNKITKKDISKIAAETTEKQKKYKSLLMVYIGSGSVSAKGFEIIDKLNELIKLHDLENEFFVINTGSNGFGAVGPNIVVQPRGTFYEKVEENDIEDIVLSLKDGKVVERLLHKDPHSGAVQERLEDIPFFNLQRLIALRNRGLIDPENINHYIARNGYKGLLKILEEKNPENVIDAIIASGIRGRGGGGFPAGIKWESALKASKKGNKEIYVICNADEGDPGAYMDRSIIEADPYSIIEGMTIGAFATGAKEGFIYVRQEYPLACKRIEKAITDARAIGLLGENILGTNFSFDIAVHRGAGAFVCGESSALMTAMTGKAGEPRAKYVRSVEVGFRGKPSILNNVETWANIPAIIEKGSEWFANIGSGDVRGNPWGGSSGTKVFSLVGNINNSGLVEVPMGITLRELIEDVGGGIPNGKKFKAIQSGGPSGGCIPESLLNTKVDFDSLTKVGSMMGSGGMIVMDEDTCMVDVARYFTEFLADESCGKCTPCREGLFHMKAILNRICSGQGKDGDIEALEELSQTIGAGSLCQLGSSAPNPVLSTIKYFREEYEQHIKEKKCVAGVCKPLIKYEINDNCTGCTVCALRCPTGAISGKKKSKHIIDQTKCIKCGICKDVCKFDAVEVK